MQLWKFELNQSSKLRDNNEEKKTPKNPPLSHKVVCFHMLDFETSNSESEVTLEGAVSHSVLYYQQLPITRYQVRFYAINYFE